MGRAAREPSAEDRTGRRPELFLYRPDGRASRPLWLTRERARYLPALGCLVLPFIFLFLIFQPAVSGLVRNAAAPATIAIESAAIIGPGCPVKDAAKPVPADVQRLGARASDVAGRYAYAIPSAALRFMALIGIGFAVSVMWRRGGYLVGTAAAAVSLGIGVMVAYGLPRQEGTRKILVEPILGVAFPGDAQSARFKDAVLASVDLNVKLGLTAMIVILIALSIVAIRARDAELTPAVLRQRLFDLRWSLIIAAVILALTVILTRALVDWQLGFLCEAHREVLKPVGNALANYWGAGSTGVLLATFLPAFFSWSRDVVRCAMQAKPEASETERQDYVKAERLDFAPSSSAATLLTVAIPALSGPLLDVAKGILDRI